MKDKTRAFTMNHQDLLFQFGRKRMAAAYLAFSDCFSLLNVLFSLLITATYRYCCRGSYCPRCPVDLFIKFAEQKILVHRGLTLDCQEHKLNQSFETFLQEGIYKINVSSSIFVLIKQYLLTSDEFTVTVLFHK